jgi:hypothetical protein
MSSQILPGQVMAHRTTAQTSVAYQRMQQNKACIRHNYYQCAQTAKTLMRKFILANAMQNRA